MSWHFIGLENSRLDLPRKRCSSEDEPKQQSSTKKKLLENIVKPATKEQSCLGLSPGCGSCLVENNLLPFSDRGRTADSVAAFLHFVSTRYRMFQVCSLLMPGRNIGVLRGETTIMNIVTQGVKCASFELQKAKFMKYEALLVNFVNFGAFIILYEI